MIDFARYAFNKSHAACYAVVTFQTAWLKCYYPVEFMAALMTSVIDNAGKCSEYMLHCRKMGIEILPPDINRSESSFSVEDGKIRYALSAVKGIGRPVMEAIEAERALNGPFKSLRDFCERLSGREVNKRTLENFIKAGAFDCFGGTRRQYMQVYSLILDQVSQERKNNLTGQMNLFDFMGEEAGKQFEIRLPDVGEFNKEEKLAFEKEVTGIYISGHPLEKYEEKWRKNVSAVTTDFLPDEESGIPKVGDGNRVTVGGMITAKTIKYTKTNQTMAFLTLEDLLGTMEIIVFPKSYEQYSGMIDTDAKVFIRGRVSVEEDRPSKLILERVIPFSEVPAEIWIRFPDRDAFEQEEKDIRDIVSPFPGTDRVIVYLEKERAMKRMNCFTDAEDAGGVLVTLKQKFGGDNVKVVEKRIEMQ